MRNRIAKLNQAHPGLAGELNRVLGGREESPSTVERDGSLVLRVRGEDPDPGIGFRHPDPDVSEGQTDSGADLDQHQTDRMTLGLHHVGSIQVRQARRILMNGVSMWKWAAWMNRGRITNPHGWKDGIRPAAPSSTRWRTSRPGTRSVARLTSC